MSKLSSTPSSPGIPGSPRGWTRIAAGLLLVLLPLAVYWPATGFGFLFDDDVHVTANSLLRAPWPGGLATFWREPYQGLYMPVTYSLWGLLVRLTGQPDPIVLHAANIILHALNTLLVFSVLGALLERLDESGDGRGAALAGALLFALHPVQVESVAWVSELKGLLAGSFTFLAIRLHLLAIRATPRRLLLTAAGTAACALAILAKPSAVCAPLLVLALDLLLLGRNPRQALAAAGPWLAAAVLLSLPTLSAQADSSLGYVTPLHLRPLVTLDALASYLRNLVWPVGLTLDYGRSPEMVLGALLGRIAWLAAAIPAALVVLLRPGRGSSRGLLLAPLAVFCAGLLPVSGLKPFLFQQCSTVADRYMYLPMLGAALAAALAVHRSRHRAVPWLAAGVLGGLALLSAEQLQVWRSDETLYRHMAETNGSFLAHTNLGHIRQAQGRTEEALAHYRLAYQAKPNNLDVNRNLGLALHRAGRHAEAAALFREMLRHVPDHGQGWVLLGAALEADGRPAEAAEAYRTGARLLPDDAPVRFRLAGVLAGLGSEEAVSAYRQALALQPDYSEAHANLATLLMRQGDPAGAEPHLRAVVRLKPGYVQAWLALGRCLESQGRQAEAADLYRELLRLVPDQPQALGRLGQLTGKE